MPIALKNDYTGTKTDPLTLATLVTLQQQGFSVMKTPHIGNQHPSNLLCAALGFHMDMVTCTQGARDQNFHPHLRIQSRVGQPLYPATVWTPKAVVPNGETAEDYHQRSVRAVFPGTVITSDMELIGYEGALAATMMRIGTSVYDRTWYRRITAAGDVQKCTQPRWELLEPDIFRFSNPESGYLVPNVLNILYTVLWQSLATGRDTVYALSGPDMVGYIGSVHTLLTRMYDAVRAEVSGLPETLTVCVVPVAQCRFLTHQSRQDALEELLDVIVWYERQPGEKRQSAQQDIVRMGARYPEFGRGIGHGDFMSQYDLVSASDLYIPDWLIDTPLTRVRNFHRLIADQRGAVNVTVKGEKAA